MRSITRLSLVLAVVATAGLVAVPATAGAKARGGTYAGTAAKAAKVAQARIAVTKKTLVNRIKRANRRISRVRDSNLEKNSAQDATLASVQETVNGIVAAVPDVISALQALEAGLKAAGNGLTAVAAGLTTVGNGVTALNAAVSNETTGLPGLNRARPQFGAFAADGTLLGGTGASGGIGPDDDAVQGPAASPVGDIDGLYVVSFNHDVSTRVYTVNVFPLGPTGAGGAAAPTASATNCSASAGAATLCGLVQLSSGGSGASDANSDLVLVQIGDGTDGAGDAPNGFSVTGLSG